MESLVETLLKIIAQFLHPLVLAAFALAGLAWGAGYLTYRKLAFRLRLAAFGLAGLGVAAAVVLGLTAKPTGPASVAGSGVDPATASVPASAPVSAAGFGSGAASIPAPAVAADPTTPAASPVTPMPAGSAAGAGVPAPVVAVSGTSVPSAGGPVARSAPALAPVQQVSPASSLVGGGPARCAPAVAAAGQTRVDCQGVTAPALDALNQRLGAQTDDIDKKIQEAENFARRFETLVKQLREEARQNQFAGQTQRLVEDANFQAAIRRADGLIARGGTAPVMAARHFQRALIRLLRFDQPGALPDLRKANELVPENADYALELAAVLWNQNAFTEAKGVLQTLLGTPAHGPGADTPDRREGRARGLNALGMVLQETNRHTEAGNQYREALRIYQDLEAADPERDRDGSASVRNNLAGLYQETQRFGEAETLYNEILTSHRAAVRSDPGRRGDLAMVLNNLGNLYAGQQRFSAASAAYRESLELYRSLAAERPEVFAPRQGSILNNQGNLYQSARDYPESEAAFTEALRIYRDLAGKNPEAYEPQVAATQNNLGILYGAMGRTAEAEQQCKAALALYARLVAGTEHEAYRRNVAMTRSNLANLYSDTDRAALALPLLKSALAVYQDLARTEPKAFEPNVAGTQNGLANVYDRLGDRPQAERHYRDALATFERLAAANPAVYRPDVAMVRTNLGTLYLGAERAADAVTELKAAVAIREGLLGPGADQSPGAQRPRQYELAQTLTYLGTAQAADGPVPAALASFERARDLLLRLAADDPGAAAIYDVRLADLYLRLGRACQKSGDEPRAQAAFTDALGRIAALPPERSGELTARVPEIQIALGRSLESQGRTEKAAEQYQEALVRLRTLAITDPAGPDNNLAVVLVRLAGLHALDAKTQDQAIADYREVLPVYRRLVAGDPKTYGPPQVSVLDNLAVAYFNRQDYQAALPLSEEGVTAARGLLTRFGNGHKDQLAEALRLQGTVQYALKDSARACQSIREAAKHARDPQTQARVSERQREFGCSP